MNHQTSIKGNDYQGLLQVGQIDSLAELNGDDAFIYLQKNLPQFCNDYRRAYEIINNFIINK